MNLQKALILFSCIYLTNCSSIQTNNIAPGYIDTYKAIKQAVFGYEDNTSITRDLVNNIPYASMTLQIGKGPTGLMILESIKEDELTWISADPIYLVTQDGRIIKTEGLDNNLKDITYHEVKFSEILQGKLKESSVYYSYSNPQLNNLKLDVKYVVKQESKITILDKSYILTLVQEEVTQNDLGWEFTNSYWVDRNGFVWKSEQTFLPQLPKFILQITKKPSE